MKTIKLFLWLTVAMLVPRLASALVVGPYTPDANTVFLFHLDEPAGSLIATNAAGSLAAGTNAVAFKQNSGITNNCPSDGTILGAAGAGSFTVGNFGNCAVITNASGISGSGTVSNGLGVDFSLNGSYNYYSNAIAPGDGLTSHSLILGANNSFTVEALINLADTNAGTREIVCSDNQGTRGFQFRLNGPNLELNTQPGVSAAANDVFAPIPRSGVHAFVANQWFHVALVHSEVGGLATNVFYWTALSDAYTAANAFWTTNSATINAASQMPLVIGNEGRLTGGSSEGLRGYIDEVRISKMARAANQMMFAPATIAINQQPVTQEGVDYGGTGGMSVSASSALPIRYQWRLNGTPITGATNATYVFTNATAAAAGNYDCVLTNSNPSSITSSVAVVTIGAANFLAHRYSFETDATDTIGAATGTFFGNANVSGGALQLDGTTGTYLQLPAYLITNTMGMVSFETWVTFGVNGNWARVFDFGNTNGANGQNYTYYSPHSGAGTEILDLSGQQTTIAGNLDSRTVHLAMVIDGVNHVLSVYTNGVLQMANASISTTLANVNDVYSFIGRSLFSADAYLTASIDEFRIYNGALSASNVKQSYAQGVSNILSDGPVQVVVSPTNTTVAQGQTVSFIGVASGHAAISYQWYKNNVLIAGATNSTYSYAPSFTDNNAVFKFVASNNVSATAYTATSGVATLTVLVPETLAWLGASDNLWNLSSLNWSNAAQSLVAYAQFDGAVFDDRGVGQPSVDLQQTFTPVSVTVSNTATDYLLYSSGANGSLTVLGTLLKQGAGKLTMDVTNNSAGATFIQNGTLQIGNNDIYGTLGSGLVTNNARLSFSRSDAGGLVVANPIHGSGAVSFDGSGTVTITGTNDYTGATLINSGIENLQSSAGLGATNAGTTVANGAQLYITANVDIGAEPLALNGVGDGNGALRKGGAGVTTYAGALTLGSDSTIGVDTGATLNLTNAAGITGTGVNLTVANVGTCTVAGPVNLGIGGLTKNGAGTLVLNSADSYSGVTTINNGVLTLNNSGALGTSTQVNVASTTGGALGGTRIVLGAGVAIPSTVALSLPCAGTTVRSCLFAAGASSWNGPITLNGDGTISPGDQIAFASSGGFMTIGGNITSVSFPGTLQLRGDGTGSGSTAATTNGFGGLIAGTITLDATATLQVHDGTLWTIASTGNTWDISEIAKGTLRVGVNNALPVATSVKFGAVGNATLDLNGFNQQVGALTLVGNLATITNGSATSDSTLTFSSAGASTFGGILRDGTRKLALTVAAGTLTLTNPATAYAGNTTVGGGSLALTQPVLATNATVSVASGAVLQLGFTVTNRVGGLVLNGVTQPPGVYDSTTGSPYITGTGSLLVAALVNTAPTNIVSRVNGGNLELSWPADHTGWRLQVQTNSLATGLGTNWVTVPGSTAVNSVTNTVNPANGSVFYRLVYP